ncbi:MAG: hypothetical protein AAF611_21015 [Bacteroidota bacterium]
MSSKIQILFISCLLTLTTSCALKKSVITKNDSNTEVYENGFHALFVFHNNTLSKASGVLKIVKEESGISIRNTSIYFKNNLVIDVATFDKEFSYLIDYFKDDKQQFLIISEVSSTYLQSSSDTNILPRNKLFICDLKTNKKYQYTYTYPKHSLILPVQYYKGLPSGITLKSIDASTKTIVFEKKDTSTVEIEVAMTAVKNF